ncbi:SDR family oxidoreductase [uncultured Nocardioides sp.]|uniref:SDR family oxidoreductase n=1 Tax=uncultured Nocardioides sp. TaxID=198441 RepID=UPI0026256DD7|nr:SDR family oxidoreductase [uncultured Nocardioides sp.]
METRVVAVTGAAAGIGRATALTFATRGWTVGAYDIDEAGLADLTEEASALPGEVRTGRLDVTDAAEFETRLGELVEATGRLDALVNNAGILLAGMFTDRDTSAHATEVDINVKGVMHGLHAGYPHLRRTASEHGDAVAVNMASASAIYGQPELANYSATKFYVRGLTEALDLEWGPQGIRVRALWPLFVQTAMTEGWSTGSTGSLGIRLTAQDIADAVLLAVEPPRARAAMHQVHFPVGFQTKALFLGSRFSPAWLTRLVNKKLAHA